jgi:peptidyl-prolyl cis-trans isomerase SurA
MIIKKTLTFMLLTLTATFGFAQDVSIDNIVAIVGQKIILKSDVETRMLQYKSRGETRSDLKCFVFEELLYQALLVNQAKIDSLDISDTQVENELERRLSYFEDQMGGREEMENYFNKAYNEIKNGFREIVQDQLLAQQMESSITEGISVTPEEVRKFYKNLPKDSLPLVESEIELAQIVINPEIKEKQIDKIKETLLEYKKRVENGEDFGFFAGLYSDDIVSAENDGDLGWVRRGDLVPEFASAAFEMTTPGQVSDIIETEYGYHLIQFIERKGERIHIRHILKIPKPSTSEKQRAKSNLDSIANLIQSNKITFENAVLLYSTDEDTKKSGGILINPQNGTSSFKSSDLNPATNYVLAQMKPGELSEPFENENNKGKTEVKIIKLISKTNPHVADFDTDYQLISNMAKEKKKSDMINKWIIKTQKTTYFKIDDEFKDCPFKFSGWLSN